MVELLFLYFIIFHIHYPLSLALFKTSFRQEHYIEMSHYPAIANPFSHACSRDAMELSQKTNS